MSDQPPLPGQSMASRIISRIGGEAPVATGVAVGSGLAIAGELATGAVVGGLTVAALVVGTAVRVGMERRAAKKR